MPVGRRRVAALLAALLVASLFTAASSRGADGVAADDPGLVRKMNQLCLRAALTGDGVDKNTTGFCRCAAPIFSRHMTAESRHRVAVENRVDVRPDYDDPKAAYDEILKACKTSER
ncbi:MAG: hypothetical protein QOK29_4630 [Rhodospirillaceae bacterium]|jgi:hypothetical protein|nr:hypothetical protein [Rhodospirillaceae bacterium]